MNEIAPALATPVGGLYLCGAGTHPGGGAMAACGHNAAADPQGPRVAAAPVGVGQTLTEEPLDSPLAIG